MNQRTKEIGIRMALGATAGAVVGLVMRQAARLAGVGAVVGLIVVFVVLKLLNAIIRLQNVSVVDAISFVGVPRSSLPRPHSPAIIPPAAPHASIRRRHCALTREMSASTGTHLE